MTQISRTKILLANLAISFGLVSAAQATVLFESLPNRTSGFSSVSNGGSTVVGRLTVSAARTVGAIGVLNNLQSGGNLKFFIADAGTGAMLYLSGAKAFAAETGQNLNLTYKVSDGLSFTFMPGTTYAVGSIADRTAYTYADAFQTNTAGGFTSLTGNENVSNYAMPTLNTATNCCAVGFELLDAPLAVPEPGTLALLGAGLLGLGVVRRRGG